LHSDLTRLEIDQVVDEFAPSDERGPGRKDLLGAGVTDLNGSTSVTYEEYENVVISIFNSIVDLPLGGKADPDGKVSLGGELLVIAWKHRTYGARRDR
jgi:hypothetical protein